MNKNEIIAKLMGKEYKESIDYFTSPADHRELELWLCKEENRIFTAYFCQYVTDEFFEDVTCKYQSVPIMLLSGLPSLLIDFLGTEAAQDKWGFIPCPDKNIIGGLCVTKKDSKCPVEEGGRCTGRIMAPWLKEMGREDA